MATAKEIWDTLSKIDVSAHVEKKGNLSYLSWAWAWGTLMNNFPQANYEILPTQTGNDGTVMTWVSITIDDVTRKMWLPAMDHRNNAIANPDMRKISDTQMRCLTKCIAMFGLGHYIYAGEDLPPSEPEPHPAIQLIDSDPMAFYVAVLGMSEEEQTEAFNSFPKGEKTKGKEKWRERWLEGKAEFDALLLVCQNFIEKEDDLGFKENVEDLDKDTKKLLWSMFDDEEKAKAKELLK